MDGLRLLRARTGQHAHGTGRKAAARVQTAQSPPGTVPTAGLLQLMRRKENAVLSANKTAAATPEQAHNPPPFV